MLVTEKKRHILKTITWRTIAFLVTFTGVLTFTKFVSSAALLATFVSIFDLLIKTLIYFFHEYFWEKSKFGRKLVDTSGCTIWLTGLPCSGKTTIALELKEKLENSLQRVEYLDGDIIRKLPNWDLGFSKEDRNENIKRVTRIASFLSTKAITICAFVSPYYSTRDFIKKCTSNFIEVYVNCPVEECELRDVKGMYKLARDGKIKNFTGIDDPYEEPESPDIICYTQSETVEQSVNKIMGYLKEKQII